MPKNFFQDTSNESLPINRENRHQYYETEIVQASEADRQIRHAEAKGRQRQAREDLLKKKLKQVAIGALFVLMLATALVIGMMIR